MDIISKTLNLLLQKGYALSIRSTDVDVQYRITDSETGKSFFSLTIPEHLHLAQYAFEDIYKYLTPIETTCDPNPYYVVSQFVNGCWVYYCKHNTSALGITSYVVEMDLTHPKVMCFDSRKEAEDLVKEWASHAKNQNQTRQILRIIEIYI